MSEAGVRGIDLFKIAGESISGSIPSWKTGEARPTRQPFCSQMEERLLLYLEYHPQVAWYGRGDISATFASTYKITTPLPTPYTISYLFEDKAHTYLPDVTGQLLDGSLLIAEAGLRKTNVKSAIGPKQRQREKSHNSREIAHSTLSRLVRRTRELGAIACVPYATYSRERALHPAFQEAIRLLYTRPTRLSLRAIAEHAELVRVAKRLQEDTGTAMTLPSYDQIRAYVKTLKQEPQVRSARGEARGPRRERQSPRSFALSVQLQRNWPRWMSIAWSFT